MNNLNIEEYFKDENMNYKIKILLQKIRTIQIERVCNTKTLMGFVFANTGEFN